MDEYTLFKYYKNVPFAGWNDIQENDWVDLRLNQQGASRDTISGFVTKCLFGLDIHDICLDDLQKTWKVYSIWRKKEVPNIGLPTQEGVYSRNGKVIRMRLQNTGEPMWERAEWVTISPEKVQEMAEINKTSSNIKRMFMEGEG